MRFVAPIAIVAAVAGGVFAAGEFPEFAERHSIPGFSSSDDDTVGTTPSNANGPLADSTPNSETTATGSTRSNNARRARPTSGTTKLWQWSGASPGTVRTVMLSIDPQIYPVDGLRWYINGAYDRKDVHGPLDAEFGLWHSSTRHLSAGDVVSACWVGRDGVERCPQIVVR